MSEIVLGLVIAVLLGYMAWDKHEGRKERSKWINALIAKTTVEYRDLELTDKVKPIEPPAPQVPDFVPEAEVSDKEFRDLIKEGV